MLNYVTSFAFVLLSSRTVALDLIPIAGYIPGSQVTDHGNMDLDQTAMEDAIALETDDGYAAGKLVYTDGGNSKAVATVVLANKSSLDKGTAMTGLTVSGDIASVTVYEDTTNTKVLQLKYVDFLACQVGGLDSATQNIAGCLIPNGSITDGTTTLNYLGVKNKNLRTLQGFSTGVESKMSEETHAIYNKNYYGFWDYGDRWVLNALNGKSIKQINNFKADFSDYGDDGRIEGAKKGVAYMIVWLYAVHEWEAAVGKCVPDVAFEQTSAIHAWDEGVAFYTGNLVGPANTGYGKLVYALANKRCTNFGTCGEDGNLLEGTSQVNIELVKLFNQGRDEINLGDCDAATATKNTIADMMYVPLIQGTIRYAYFKSIGGSEKAQAEGATFAAAVLARVHAADPSAAKIIADNMAISSTTANVGKVKAAFESVYSSMNINCALVGGLTDSLTEEYYEGMEPCVTTCPESKNKKFSSKDFGKVSCGELSGFTDAAMSFMCENEGGAKACPGCCSVGGCTFEKSNKKTNKKKKKKKQKKSSKKSSSKKAAIAARSGVIDDRRLKWD